VDASDLIKEFEGCHKVKADGLVYPYTCPAGYPTQGWGLVVPSLSVPAISRGEADTRLAAAIPNYRREVLLASPGVGRFVARTHALTSFVFNLGGTRYRASTLRRKVNAEEWDDAAEEFGKWVWGGGRKLPGLVRRRAAERRVFEDELG